MNPPNSPDTIGAKPGSAPKSPARSSATETSGRSTESQRGQETAPASTSSSGSASRRADEAAKRGEPLSADKPRDRSPKQENL